MLEDKTKTVGSFHHCSRKLFVVAECKELEENSGSTILQFIERCADDLEDAVFDVMATLLGSICTDCKLAIERQVALCDDMLVPKETVKLIFKVLCKEGAENPEMGLPQLLEDLAGDIEQEVFHTLTTFVGRGITRCDLIMVQDDSPLGPQQAETTRRSSWE